MSAKAPQPNQKRYRGRIRADMRTALNAINRLVRWNTFFNAQPITYYPNQLANGADMLVITSAQTTLGAWLTLKGPVPSR